MVEGIKKWLADSSFVGADNSCDMWRSVLQYPEAVHQGMRLYKKGLELYKSIEVIEKSGIRGENHMPSFLVLDARVRGLRLKFGDQPGRRDTGTGIAANEDDILSAVDKTRLQLYGLKYPGRVMVTISQTVEQMRGVEKGLLTYRRKGLRRTSLSAG